MTTPPFRLEMLDPATLRPHPNNFRVATKEGLSAIRASVDETGWVAPLLYNERTGYLLNGHKRRQLFAGQSCPVLVGNWDEVQEAKVLLYHDQIGNFSEFDSAAFAALIDTDGLNTDSPELMSMLSNLFDELGITGDDAAEADDEPEEIEEIDDEPPARSDVPDALWPSDNEYGIPTLDLRRQANAVDFPVTIWGSVGRTKAMKGTWCFYTDDRRFASLWDNPAAVFKSKAPTAIEPNFSTHGQVPRAVSIYRTYMKRWLARYWQSQGMRIFVDINVDASVRDLNFVGVPKGWQAYATRSHGNNPDVLEVEHAAACAHSGRDDLTFLVYGGGKSVEALCGRRGWNWIPEHSASVRQKGVTTDGQA